MAFLKEDQVKLALDALKKYLTEVEAKKKPDLLKDDQFVYLTGEYKTAKPYSSSPKRILLPHGLNEPGAVDVCIFTKNPKAEVKKLFQEKGVKLIIKVIPLTKIGTHFKSFERRKQLAGMYDVFLADSKIFHLLFKKLGKAFLFKRGPPFPVDLSKPNLKSELNAAISATHYRTSKTTALSVRIGKLSMPSEHLLQNCLTVCKYLGKHVPRGWKEIKALYIKTVTSVSLPIHNSLDVMIPTKMDDEGSLSENQDGVQRKRLRVDI